MKHILSFLSLVFALKKTPRTGWVLRGVKNPETIAEHVFRTTMLSWVLGAGGNLRIQKVISMSILHELCEVYAGDMTPYHEMLPSSRSERATMLKRWIRLPRKEKEKAAVKKFIKEKRALEKLINPLRESTKKEIMALWLEYEKGLSPEGRFVKQVDKIEAFFQAIEYFGIGLDTPVFGWWEEIEELVTNPVLAQFVKALEHHFYHGQKTEYDGIIQFCFNLGVLKRIPRPGWVVRKVKNPDSIANHITMHVLMLWIFAKETAMPLNVEKLFKIGFMNGIAAGYVAATQKNTSSYDLLFKKAKNENQRQKLLKKWVRYSVRQKQEIFLRTYKEEKIALRSLVKTLDPRMQSEMMGLWEESKKNHTKEANFMKQVYVLETLFQALLYWSKDYKFPIEAWWEWAFERVDSDFSIAFMDELKRHFYSPKLKKSS